MEYYVPCPCEGKDSPCFSCLGTGSIGPLSVYEKDAFYENQAKQAEARKTDLHRNDFAELLRLIAGVDEVPPEVAEEIEEIANRNGYYFDNDGSLFEASTDGTPQS